VKILKIVINNSKDLMEMDRKICLVTGGTGFVGSHLVDYLLQKEYRVRVLTRKGSNLKWLKDKEVVIYDCGYDDKIGVEKAVKGIDFLFHVAGVVKAKTWNDYLEGNVKTTENLLQIVEETNPKIEKVVIVSSLAANGPAKSGIFSDENTTPNPITRYGKSKLEQEKLAKSYFSKLPITIVRPPAVYGERDTEIFLFFKTFKNGLMTKIGYNQKLVSLVHVSDLVEGIFLAGISPHSQNEIFCIGSDKYYSWDEIADATFLAFQKKPITIKIPHFLVFGIGAIAEFISFFSTKPATFNFEKAKDFVQNYQTCTIRKAEKILGYKPKVNLVEGIKRTVDWYRDNNWL